MCSVIAHGDLSTCMAQDNGYEQYLLVLLRVKVCFIPTLGVVVIALCICELQRCRRLIIYTVVVRPAIAIYTIILLKSVAVRKLQVAILARSYREMSQTVRIH